MKIDLTPYQPYEMTGVRAMFSVPPPEMLVEGFLPKSQVTAIVSYPGVGKTWVSLALGQAVATQTPFLGHFPINKMGNVVFVGQDSSINDYGVQLRKLIGTQYDEFEEEIRNGFRETNPFEDKLHFIIDPGFLFESESAVLRMVKTLRGVVHGESLELYEGGRARVVGESGTDLVIFDTYSSMTRINQNDNTLTEINFRNLRLIARLTGAAVVLLHHNAKRTEYNEGESFRGASAGEAAIDNWFNLIKPPRGAKDRYLVKVKRFRGMRPDDFHYFLKVDKQHAHLTYDDGEQDPQPSKDAPEGQTPSPPDSCDTVLIDFLAANRGKFFDAAELARRTWEMGRLLSDASITEDSWTRKVRRRLAKLIEGPYVEAGPRVRNSPTFTLKEVSDGSSVREPQDGDDHQAHAGGSAKSGEGTSELA